MNKDIKFTVEDLKHYDTQIYNSIKMISSTNFTPEEIESLYLNFTVEIYDRSG